MAINSQTENNQILEKDQQVAYSPVGVEAILSDPELSADLDEDELDESFLELSAFELWKNVRFVSESAEGEFHVQLPENVRVAEEVIVFSREVVNTYFPLPQGARFNIEGDLIYQIPQGAKYFEEQEILVIPSNSANIEIFPKCFYPKLNKNNTISLFLPNGSCDYSEEDNHLIFSYEFIQSLCPEHIDILEDGSLELDFVETENIDKSQSFVLSENQVLHLCYPAPSWTYLFDEIILGDDGSVFLETPIPGTTRKGRVLKFSHTLTKKLLDNERFELKENSAGVYHLVEDAQYDEKTRSLHFSEGEVLVHLLPELFHAFRDSDGGFRCQLPTGVDFNEAENAVILSTYWINKILPEVCHLDDQNNLHITLPLQTDFHADGGLSIPRDEVNFLRKGKRSYLNELGFVHQNNDGSVSIELQEDFDLNEEEGTLEVPFEYFSALPFLKDISFNLDGTIELSLLNDCFFNPHTSKLSLFNGKRILKLETGFQYNELTKSIYLDQFLSNQILPESLEFTSEGSILIHLPTDTEYYEDGSFIISADNINILDFDFCPEYALRGPSFIQRLGRGEINVDLPEDISLDQAAGLIDLSLKSFEDYFGSCILDELTFLEDGSMTILLEEEVIYNEEKQQLILPKELYQLYEIPSLFSAKKVDEKNIMIQLITGMEFDSETRLLKLDNDWTNELTAKSLEFTEEGRVYIALPSDTVFYDARSFLISKEQNHFIDQPLAEYLFYAPDFIKVHQAGVTCFELEDERYSFDSDQKNISLTLDFVKDFFDYLIPEGVFFLERGEMKLDLLESFQQIDGQLLMPFEDGFEIFKYLQKFSCEIEEGVIKLNLDSEYFRIENNALILSEHACNKILPEFLSYSTEGMFILSLPEKTIWHENGDLTILK